MVARQLQRAGGVLGHYTTHIMTKIATPTHLAVALALCLSTTTTADSSDSNIQVCGHAAFLKKRPPGAEKHRAGSSSVPTNPNRPLN